MSLFLPATLAGVLLISPSSVSPVSQPQYHWTPGQTLRYLIQKDPYFDDPKAAIETITSDTDYKPPVVERLTEKVAAVKANGTAVLVVTLAPEPGFEDEAHPQPTISRTVVVSASGQIVSGTALAVSPEAQDLLRGIVSISPDLRMRKDGLAVKDRSQPLAVIQSTSPDHDGTLQQTTQIAEAEHQVFDCRRGHLVRAVITRTITLSLVMTNRGRRGSDDFGHVVPNSEVIQTLSVERQADELKTIKVIEKE